jgi:hypothetical protein
MIHARGSRSDRVSQCSVATSEANQHGGSGEHVSACCRYTYLRKSCFPGLVLLFFLFPRSLLSPRWRVSPAARAFALVLSQKNRDPWDMDMGLHPEVQNRRGTVHVGCVFAVNREGRLISLTSAVGIGRLCQIYARCCRLVDQVKMLGWSRTNSTSFVYLKFIEPIYFKFVMYVSNSILHEYSNDIIYLARVLTSYATLLGFSSIPPLCPQTGCQIHDGWGIQMKMEG